MSATFGFLAHPISTGHRHQVRALDLLSRLYDDQRGTPPPHAPRHHVPLPLLTSVTSATGDRCTGEVRYLPYTAQQMLRRPTVARDMVVAEVTALREEAGAELVGLGGATSIVGDRGEWTARHVGIPVTSGNSLTVYAAHQELLHTVRLIGLEPERTRVAVVGYPGSIALAIARLLLADGFPLDLVARRGNRPPAALLRYLDDDHHERVRIVDSVAECTAGTRLFVSASSVGGLVDPAKLPPGSVVVDVALPRDVQEPPPPGSDVLVIDGGLVSATDAVTVGDGSLPSPGRQLNGCLAETMVLALEGRPESFSLGRELDLERVRTIGRLAARHGFLPTPLASFGRTVPDAAIERLARHHGRGAHGRTEDVTALTTRRFREHVNPPMARLFAAHGLDRVFTSAKGTTLTTADGTDYLDFIAGYGCLNLGHNHPEVTARLRRFLDDGSPTFIQYVSMPAQTAELAERLTALAPGRLGRVFFGNSGTEAVEAALKLARAGTGRTRLVYAENSYHGKTLGALSVTGRDAHRGPFGPLLPDTVAVPYGDLTALAEAVEGAAAFIVEPVQGEGGVVLPPEGYLRAARELCRTAGAAFVLDEIQTGLGRTGALFAADHDGLDPDILCLAKSLSGGLVPISATLCRDDLWDAAYGTTNRSMLHSSTFGGGNFAAAAGLATLDVLTERDLPGHARKVGDHLRARLREATAPYGFVKEVRGIGLMTALEFDGDFSGAVGSITDEVLTRLPGDLHTLVDWLPDDLRSALSGVGKAVESTLGDLMCLRFVGSLARDHRILTFVTANHNRVLRIQPPLILETAEADRFADSVAAVCAGLALHADLAAWRPSAA
ncbi:acetylornithine/succinyldiaminopimelate/putrescine aminotransferase/predicted amino acid dehydrogenase [Streptomyces olivoverticillatus]|uniref:Acetylornithine/succinyldiaminopimelate/putresci ne aminotransferase/predicted amino acid dehydrogenase n=1 Tax=Streptomyces olivoverticillatus TaxID=66427 RepID=A0A7W7LTI1_9ACTN|nr:aminotransferase class III-fold pyridoxal phosphate-dependent enzyme [Streptomyces olivoverticillatus]MBB4895513.1 acetylornithine/succinyldiaminopimelate/putrescine aminotransferase/predicted amino acid dehydrogenase [Streptomyces olivoverticillatus]